MTADFCRWGCSVGLKDGVRLSGAEASLKTIASRLETAFPKDNASRSVALTPLTDAAVGVNNHGQIAIDRRIDDGGSSAWCC